MREVIPLNRLQPYLFDRLTAPLPDGPLVMDEAAMHVSIVRDLLWLLNAKANSTEINVARFPTAADSVLNFGMADLTALPLATATGKRIRDAVRQAIVRFEPRIDPMTLVIREGPPIKTNGLPTINLEIEAQVWLQIFPKRMEHVKLPIEFDLQTGRAAASEEPAP